VTFCLAMAVADGLVGLADTRVTSGAEAIVSRKVSVHQHGRHAMFLMTSGLRSVRDKALIYFDEALEREDARCDKLYKAANILGEQVRQVAAEDKAALTMGSLHFDLHCLVGGQLEHDREPKLYLVYPQGNWVEVSEGTPYFVIGETAYGKPLLDRALSHWSTLEEALKIGYLAFDATRTSATDVDFPLDVVLYRPNSYEVSEHRFEHPDLAHVSAWWNSHLKGLIHEVPSGWVAQVLSKPARADATVTQIPLHPVDP
jgi:putative proteasome-type protease